MEFFEVLYGRRAVRKYKPDPVSKEDIMKILDAANYAPSGRNLQQWEFIVVSGTKGIEATSTNSFSYATADSKISGVGKIITRNILALPGGKSNCF